MSAVFVRTVGVAPGTTTMHLGRHWDPYVDMVSMNGMSGLRDLSTDRPIRWDLVGAIGGGSLIVALGLAFLASTLR